MRAQQSDGKLSQTLRGGFSCGACSTPMGKGQLHVDKGRFKSGIFFGHGCSPENSFGLGEQVNQRIVGKLRVLAVRTREFLLISSSRNKTIGICGINIDPYFSNPEVARLRHLYVLPAFRSQGIGTKLVRECLTRSKIRYSSVRLRVPDVSTGLFYENLGFEAIQDPTATHKYALN